MACIFVHLWFHFFLFVSSFFSVSFLHFLCIEFSIEPAPFSFKLGWGLTTPSQSSSTSSPTTFLHQSPSTTITTTTAGSTSTDNLSALSTNHVRHSTDIRDPAEPCKCDSYFRLFLCLYFCPIQIYFIHSIVI